MKKQYGKKKGESIFYATANKDKGMKATNKQKHSLKQGYRNK